MLHLLKLSVGTTGLTDLRTWQAERAATHPPLRHRTRHRPRRAAEIIDGGSIYWVINGAVLARQLVLDIIEDQADDGSACAGLVLDAALVPVAARLLKPFQGWRYLEPGDAPPDLAAGRATGAASSDAAALPEALRLQLVRLCLL